MQRRGPNLAALGGPLAAAAVVAGLYLAERYSYVLFHSLVEIFAILIASATFILAWNSRRFLANGYLLFIGISSLSAAAIALAHTLAYKGVVVFRGYDSNLPTQLWIAERYVASLSLLIAPLYLTRRLRVYPALLAYAAVTALLLAAIFSQRWFPDAYVENKGLTPFKIYSEYAICLVFLGAIWFLYRRRHLLDRDVYRLLTGSLIVSIAGELAFTLYVGVYDLPNMIGHLLNVLAVYLMYRAIISTGLIRPYDLLFRELKQARDELEKRVAERTAELSRREAALSSALEEVRQSHAELQELSRRLVEVQEDERRKIARELHDEAGQALTALKLNLGLLARDGDCPETFVARIEEMKETTDDVLEDLHRLAVDLRPVSLDRLGLVPALRQCVQLFERQTTGEVEFVTYGLTNEERFPAEVETTIYRVVQEALTNASRHAHASRVGIILERRAGHIVAIVEDNGVGFDVDEAAGRGRLGLMGMRERVEMLDGSLTVESSPGSGATILVEVPLSSAAVPAQTVEAGS